MGTFFLLQYGEHIHAIIYIIISCFFFIIFLLVMSTFVHRSWFFLLVKIISESGYVASRLGIFD